MGKREQYGNHISFDVIFCFLIVLLGQVHKTLSKQIPSRLYKNDDFLSQSRKIMTMEDSISIHNPNIIPFYYCSLVIILKRKRLSEKSIIFPFTPPAGLPVWTGLPAVFETRNYKKMGL